MITNKDIPQFIIDEAYSVAFYKANLQRIQMDVSKAKIVLDDAQKKYDEHLKKEKEELALIDKTIRLLKKLKIKMPEENV